MSNTSYNVIRSFNQYLDNNFGTGNDSRLRLKAHDTKAMDADTVTVHFYDHVPQEYCGRKVGGSAGRTGDWWAQIDCWSPPNSAGQSREGANRQLKDEIETVLRTKVRIPLLTYDGTGGTTQLGAMNCRQTGAKWIPDPGMEGWSRWSLEYRIKAVDAD